MPKRPVHAGTFQAGFHEQLVRTLHRPAANRVARRPKWHCRCTVFVKTLRAIILARWRLQPTSATAP